MSLCQEQQTANSCIVPATVEGPRGLAGCCGPWTPVLVQHSGWEAAFKLPSGTCGEERASPF